MNLKRFTRGPFLYVTLFLLLVLSLSGGLRGDGGYEQRDTSRVLDLIAEGGVRSTDTEGETAQVLDREQRLRVTLDDGTGGPVTRSNDPGGSSVPRTGRGVTPPRRAR